jgi:hypothetical protein
MLAPNGICHGLRRLLANRKPRIVDEDINDAMLCTATACHFSDVGRVRDVKTLTKRPKTHRTKFLCRGLDALLIKVDQHNRCTRLTQSLSAGEANALATTGNHGNATVDTEFF